MADTFDEEIPQVIYTENVAFDDSDDSTSEAETRPTDEPATENRSVDLKRKANDEDASEEPTTTFCEVDNHTNVVATHYNQLEERGRAERSKSRIFHMRNFNNWIKSVLINEFLSKVKEFVKLGEPLRSLDMCCGKGGDLLKWENSGITHLICTDIAEVSVQQCEERYKTMIERNQRNRYPKKLFTAEFFASDSTLQRLREKYKDPSIRLQLVSCQFAFHYCFESLTQAECMIRNAAECLQPGGYFIGTIPDANDIMKRQREANSDEFGNDIFRISFLCDTETPPLFGAKYNFELDGVVNCPEFLVHFPLLVKLATKFGLKLVLKERFEDFFERHKNTSKGLLEKINALETYPPFNQREAADLSVSPEYAHVKGYSKGRTCGTLSKSEWEVSSLYLVFAFQKMKEA
ncbi:mRNA cap guanine-N7 methyltransferase-like [Contarinia nasturtii]|uniref:mRNA cap guanine-N7 methyltransferase-like n=1 Tax=Contarinia nasturtii TaxID=265458 RepID=UPI0012D3A590|nr:mRNA cap guanine-N7 methyltransferase-like [Contarinia nasturtii]XP_031635632.1 mRNA cap guanine-N7 methyltransferase-like [Contarinia nasturtii]